ncbi:hypothetical protein B0186_00885 [Canicola haemoglobinophilus]|uniref:Toluene tolerance family protein n=1 Tax=Canicola haemoglobinophilus TaxID=733 RepID=A0A1V4B3J6_9PAST|nr:ABC transporter substrate-binding protein [Canicola haemoglobinophilus]OOS01947.1 hypothetical protein B0186_00885 [Canicola haemoglobinophilus]STO54167.1 toluene tolerance family protein [Canicola haemoglobinophilus]STO60398.1 toluene tolerance family protein [Canicola haemoglobinophilus]STO68700.1 toluene tolerance family protein [Canicola haemoglobinophilus]
MLKKLFSKIIVVMTALFSVQAMAEKTPYELTLDVSDRLFKAIDSSQTKIKQDPNYLRTIVREELMPYAYVSYAGAFFLGKTYYKSTPVEQREKFFAVFDKFIEYQYAKALTLYNNQKIQVLKPTNVVDDKMSISVKILQNSNAAPIDLVFYWLKNKAGKWQVYDMAVGGVSTIDSTKQEWLPTLRKKGIEVLIKEMETFSKQAIILSK